MSATLRVTHELNFGIELRRGEFEVLADGKAVGSVAIHEFSETPLEPGHHTVRMRKGRYSSREVSFDVADEEVAGFRCHGVRLWPVWVASVFVPGIGISLQRE